MDLVCPAGSQHSPRGDGPLGLADGEGGRCPLPVYIDRAPSMSDKTGWFEYLSVQHVSGSLFSSHNGGSQSVVEEITHDE